MTRFLFLVRHADSTKNRKGTFSGDNISDEITREGELEIRCMVAGLKNRLAEYDVGSSIVCTANSGRATHTAEAISNSLSMPVATYSELGSIRSGRLSGVTEETARGDYAEYMRWLDLYRVGLASSYDIPRPEDAEPLVSFEARIEAVLTQILCSPEESKVVVAHRSPITAILLSFARKYHGYPLDFFGFVPLSTCGISLVNIEAGRIEFVDSKPDSVLSCE